MAERRMFSKLIIDSDAFTDMPLSTQALYFHLSMRADDEGFINNPKKIQRMIGCSEDDLKILLAKRYLLAFESGVVVIKHWKIHNIIRNDRLKPTVYEEEKSLLTEKPNGSYTEKSRVFPDDNQFATIPQPNDNQLATKCPRSIGEDSIEEYSLGEYNAPAPARETRHKYGEYQNVLLSDSDLEKLKTEFPDWEQRIERLSSYMASTGKSYKSHLATIRNWARKDPKPKETSHDVNEFFEAAVRRTQR